MTALTVAAIFMSQKTVRIGLTSLVLAVAFGGLLYTSLGETAQYYKYVNEVMAEPDAWYGKPLQVHGYARDIRRKRDSLDWSFELHREGQVMRATYTGITPDTFLNDSEVVLQGTLGPNGFHATSMTAKCPSKYEPQAIGTSSGPKGTTTY